MQTASPSEISTNPKFFSRVLCHSENGGDLPAEFWSEKSLSDICKNPPNLRKIWTDLNLKQDASVLPGLGTPGLSHIQGGRLGRV